MITVSILYDDLPVTINSQDVEDLLGKNLYDEIGAKSDVDVKEFLDTVHRIIYDFLIYTTGDKTYKDRLIIKFKDELEKDIKKALLVQTAYILNSGGNLELFNGLIRSETAVDLKLINDVVSRILAPSIINILSSTKPNILYAGA